MTELTSREILDAIRRGLAASARQFEQAGPDPTELQERTDAARAARNPVRTMADFTSREILDAIDRGLEASARQFEKERPDQKDRPVIPNAHLVPEPPPDETLQPAPDKVLERASKDERG